MEKKYTFTEADVGCHADGAFGMAHVYERLAGLLPDGSERLADELCANDEWAHEAADEALNILNDATEPGKGLSWRLEAGDLLLVQEPDEEDYILRPDSTVARYGCVTISRNLLNGFDDDAAALAAIRAQMETEKFWPNVWRLDNRGGLTLLTLEDK